MPSFLTDDNSTIFNTNPDILNLDPNNQFGLTTAKERVNAGSIRHTRSDTINESFDESSVSSTHGSDISETTPTPMNGNGTRPTSMSSLSNGKSVTTVPSRQDDNSYQSYQHKPLPNGTANLVDRTLPPLPTSDVNGSDDFMAFNQSKNYHGLSKPLPSDPFPTEDFAEKLPSKSFDGTLLTTSTTSDPAHALPRTNPSSSHRLSSPPIYSGNTAASSSGHLQPTAPPPLKQRHTLEVPKLTPGRPSKDGMDTAQASGRFSPTATTAPTGRRPSMSLGRRPTRSMQSDGPRDEVMPDEDAQRWAEAYRQKRATKRRRKEEEDGDRVLVGTMVDETHANWVTAYNMLTGIRVSVSRTNAKLDRELTDADFETKQKSTFDM
jgi:1-phosphatidylinositol-4-phosphate 5-kinase